MLVAIHAAAITFDELTWPDTWASGGVDRTPIIPSHEFSGVVATVGDGVTEMSIGGEVYGLVPFDRDGAAAEYVSMPAISVAARPRTVSHVVAAAAVLPALTAWEALVDHAAVKSGQRVLVHGGAGGVGSFVTQLATGLGARVTSTAHTPDVEHVLALGAERVINTEQESLDAETGVFDVVIDAVGRDVPGALFAGAAWWRAPDHPPGASLAAVGRQVGRQGPVRHRDGGAGDPTAVLPPGRSACSPLRPVISKGG